MTWLARLYDSYEQAMQQKQNTPLLPICHTVQNAHVKIVIDGKGNFRSADVLEKTQCIIPATERSAGRSSGCAPHALCDKLQYVAKDYVLFGGEKKSYFTQYEEQLRQWCESEYANPKAQAILNYIQKGEVIHDLVNVAIFPVSDAGKFLKTWQAEIDPPTIFRTLPKKKNNITQENEIEPGDALVIWEVQIFNDDETSETWKNSALQTSWINYDISLASKHGQCDVTRQLQSLATSHPARLRHSGDKAKLISSNDNDGFTFKGRFQESDEAFVMGFEFTQKAHNALRWLINRQGYRNGDQVILAWTTSGVKVRPPVEEQWKIELENFEEDIQKIAKSLQEKSDKIDHSQNMGQIFAERLKKRLAGYRALLADNDEITLLILDSATPGRMAIVYYQELNKDDYFDALDKWAQDFSWYQRVPLAGQAPLQLIAPPAPWLVAKVAYGESVDDKLKKQIVERIFSCIVEQKQVPKNLVESCLRAATNPLAYKADEQWRWSRNISVACSLYRGYCARVDEKHRREYAMSLETECTNRDYLYGRLLALAEKIERRALKKSGEKRITNAQRLMQHFSVKPYTTWETLRKSLQPYINRLITSEDVGWIKDWENEIENVSCLFKHEDFISNRKLTGEFLLGYYCQKNYIKNKSESNESINEGVNNESE